MIKQSLLIHLIVISSSLASSHPCPTCPKSHIASSLEAMLVAHQKDKNQTSFKKLSNLTPTQSELKVTTSKQTPVQIVASRTDQLKKLSSSRPNKSDLGAQTYKGSELNNTAKDQFIERQRQVENYEQRRQLTMQGRR